MGDTRKRHVLNMLRLSGSSPRDKAGADPGFPGGRGCQSIIWPNVPKHYMKTKKIGPKKGARVQNFIMYIRHCKVNRTFSLLSQSEWEFWRACNYMLIFFQFDWTLNDWKPCVDQEQVTSQESSSDYEPKKFHGNYAWSANGIGSSSSCVLKYGSYPSQTKCSGFLIQHKAKLWTQRK